MYKLYTIDNKRRSKVKGFWRDDKGKVYIDNVYIVNCKTEKILLQGIKSLFDNKEKAVFYTFKGKGYIIDNQGKADILKYRLRLKRLKLSISEVKSLSSIYGGLSIYKMITGYIIEVYHK